ncbi:hypothetical protein IE81DRAFT_326810 [Ceraceosorus guamensis]|uniref:F-box domain-containing protein n=1 Tax=Ceraceosorus guamensis TaxID=1522189 RepID=A0A316VSJ5_9BASI|nr:hypothetical protein IE81DRAFT_326810 [Ceraceosorus guamensis]PWN39161.1 hypothetical protein IE81DRAFT_326810 [Ceraceosorus guamensis]
MTAILTITPSKRRADETGMDATIQAPALLASASIIRLPPELLDLILVSLDAHSLLALHLTCKRFQSHVASAAHLWKLLYDSRWDTPDGERTLLYPYIGHPLETAVAEASLHHDDAPSRAKNKGKAKARALCEQGDVRPAISIQKSLRSHLRHEFRPDEQAKRFARAATLVRMGAECELIMLANQADVCRTLLAALHSRTLRCNRANGILPPSRASQTLTRLFDDTPAGRRAFAVWIYPRAACAQVAEWQRQQHNTGIAGQRGHVMQESILDGQFSSASTAEPLFKKNYKANASSNGARSTAAFRGGDRRSARLRHASTPQHLRYIFEKATNLGGAYKRALPTSLEEIPPVDEELAAELHCHYGPREMLDDVFAQSLAHKLPNRGDSHPRMNRKGTLRSVHRRSEAQCKLMRAIGSSIEHTPGAFVDPGSSSELEDEEADLISDPRLWYPANTLTGHAASLGSTQGPPGDVLLRAAAKRIVYDTARWGTANGWGPFHAFDQSGDAEDNLPANLRHLDPLLCETERNESRSRIHKGEDSTTSPNLPSSLAEIPHYKYDPQLSPSANDVMRRFHIATCCAPSWVESQLPSFLASLTTVKERLSCNPDASYGWLQDHLSRYMQSEPAEHVFRPPDVVLLQRYLFGETAATGRKRSSFNLTSSVAPESDVEEGAEISPATSTDASGNDEHNLGDSSSELDSDGIIEVISLDSSQGSPFPLDQPEDHIAGAAQADDGVLFLSEDESDEDFTSETSDYEGLFSLMEGDEFGSDSVEFRLRLLIGQAQGGLARREMRNAKLRRLLHPIPHRKTVNWLALEAIQTVMRCNILHARQVHHWGAAFASATAGPRSLNPQLGAPSHDDFVDPEHAKNRTSHLLLPPWGWAHSRGEKLQPQNLESPDSHDWAHIEGVWIGTYAFLDFSDWLAYNGLVAAQRGHTAGPHDHQQYSNPPKLTHVHEAVGDFLELRLRLLSAAEKSTRADLVDVSSEHQDPDYPPLHFEGATYHYTLEEEDGDVSGGATRRGRVHGVARPVFATSGDESIGQRRAIAAIHMTFTHSYDGEERWKLEGVQAGPPGSRAAVYGIWTDANRGAIQEVLRPTDPCGPWTYWRVDERKWKDVLEELQQRKHAPSEAS